MTGSPARRGALAEFLLDGKHALVSGGTAGIGLAVAERFAAAGASVTITGRRPEGDAIAAGISARCLHADVSEEDDVRQVIEACAPLDVLVLNAGVAPLELRIEDTDTDAMERCFDVNFRHVWWGLHHAPVHMADGGSIVVTASTVARVKAPNVGDYAAAKSAAISLVKTAALEMGERRIRVNAVLPGTTLSEMTPPDHWEMDAMRDMLPLGRAATTDDVVGLYQFLAADASAYVTGQAIAVDGGMTAGLSYGLLRGVGSPW